jgi:hypothetical protein
LLVLSILVQHHLHQHCCFLLLHQCIQEWYGRSKECVSQGIILFLLLASLNPDLPAFSWSTGWCTTVQLKRNPAMMTSGMHAQPWCCLQDWIVLARVVAQHGGSYYCTASNTGTSSSSTTCSYLRMRLNKYTLY